MVPAGRLAGSATARPAWRQSGRAAAAGGGWRRSGVAVGAAPPRRRARVNDVRDYVSGVAGGGRRRRVRVVGVGFGSVIGAPFHRGARRRHLALAARHHSARRRRRRRKRTRGRSRVADTAEIGVFGGSGFYSLLEDVREVKVDTPYGAPSDSLFLAEVAGRRVAFLPRHGRRHTIPPHRINYRANVWAMKSLGVKAAISPCAAGSLRCTSSPATSSCATSSSTGRRGRADTFYDGPIVTHLSSADTYDPVLRQLAIETIRDHGIEVHERGTVVVIQGPRFSTKSESKWFSDAGWEVINMTQYPEAWLCRELGIAVVNISLITDYDAGVHEGTEAVNATERPRGLPGERRADPEGRARPHRPVPGRPRCARCAWRAGTDPRRRSHDRCRGHPAIRDGALSDGGRAPRAADRLPIGVCLRSIRAEPDWWLKRPPPRRGRLSPACGAGTTSWAVAIRRSPSSRLDDPVDGRGPDVAPDRRYVRDERHEPPPGGGRPDGLDPPDRQRRPADARDRDRRRAEGARGLRDGLPARRPSGSPGSRRPSPSSGRCGPAGR